MWTGTAIAVCDGPGFHSAAVGIPFCLFFRIEPAILVHEPAVGPRAHHVDVRAGGEVVGRAFRATLLAQKSAMPGIRTTTGRRTDLPRRANQQNLSSPARENILLPF